MGDSLSDARQTGEQLLSTANDKLEGAGDKLQAAGDKLRGARDRISEAGGEALARVRDGASAVDEFVNENPWQAVAVSALVGLLIGVLVSNSRR